MLFKYPCTENSTTCPKCNEKPRSSFEFDVLEDDEDVLFTITLGCKCTSVTHRFSATDVRVGDKDFSKQIEKILNDKYSSEINKISFKKKVKDKDPCDPFIRSSEILVLEKQYDPLSMEYMMWILVKDPIILNSEQDQMIPDIGDLEEGTVILLGHNQSYIKFQDHYWDVKEVSKDDCDTVVVRSTSGYDKYINSGPTNTYKMLITSHTFEFRLDSIS